MNQIKCALLPLVALFALGPNIVLAENGRVKISKGEFAGKWPFSVNEAELLCRNGGEVVLFANFKSYAVNGTAMRDKTLKKVEEIWLQNPKIPGTRIDMSPIVERGRELCK